MIYIAAGDIFCMFSALLLMNNNGAIVDRIPIYINIITQHAMNTLLTLVLILPRLRLFGFMPGTLPDRLRRPVI